MDLRQMIICDYQERVAMKSGIDSELRRALKTHERVPVFLDNLVKQIQDIPRARKTKGLIGTWTMDRMKLKNLVYEMTDFFIKNVETLHDERSKSEIARQMIKDKSSNEFDGLLDNQGNGEVKDLGVTVVEDRTQEK